MKNTREWLKMVGEVRYFDDRTIVVRFRESMEVVSTLPVVSPSGLSSGPIDTVVFREVSEEDVCCDLLGYYRKAVEEVGVERALVVLTSASLKQKFKHFHIEEGGTDIYMTVSLTPASCLESRVYKPISIGTINIVVATNTSLTHNAMVDLLRAIVEAKTLASVESLLYCGSRASGTISDSVSVLRPVSLEGVVLFAGISTDIGNAVARVVHEQIVSESVSRDLSRKLSDVVGVDIDTLGRLFSKIYEMYPIDNLSSSEVTSFALKRLKRTLSDPNVWSLLIAARELDLHGISGSIPGLSRSEFLADSKRLVADEILGMSLAAYLAGVNGIMTMYWVERLKEEGLLEHQDLGIFEDDVVSALLAFMIVDSIRELGYGET
ncbi:MAG: adenosylcobinamide amidohydrolase [Sulfolobales archaeon]|nr:adenosylcobinamide amidohydrolase [Sulfolobales archaeon]MDW8082224.1 adenosylcobinamide amidohydrolase [Sulfolobales archaeon]